MSAANDDQAPSRGPADHAVRSQIIEAANDCFARYGYGKTTVSDLAKEIGFSKAYIYRFFESKQAIGEEICRSRLDQILAAARAAIDESGTASEKFRKMFKTLTSRSVEMFFEDRKIYDIAAHSTAEGWDSSRSYQQSLRDMIGEVIEAGRESGEFERKTPMDETVRAIAHTMSPFVHPIFLERNLDTLPDAQNEVASLILRSLAR